MYRFYSYLNSANRILSKYKGQEPFSIFLKSFFRNHKKYGSRDRREIGNLCYCYFRLGKGFKDFSTEERILTGLFLCSDESKIIKELKPDWAERVSMPLKDKLQFLEIESELSNVFPWEDKLSDGMNHLEYSGSFFVQPDVFLRLRPKKEKQVILKLKKAKIEFRQILESTISIAASSKVDQILKLDEEVVIQDLSSQKTGEVMNEILDKDNLSLWDCCAASGGKSIMAYDVNTSINLTVSDVRKSILHNLRKRFSKAGINSYRDSIIDLKRPQLKISDTPFDIILADVPCTGSGTWSRTPEQLYYFKDSKIKEYAELQKAIVENAIPHLKEDGFLVYITCSVFKEENEKNVEYIASKHGFKKVKSELIKGYNQKADSMFVALLQKSE